MFRVPFLARSRANANNHARQMLITVFEQVGHRFTMDEYEFAQEMIKAREENKRATVQEASRCLIILRAVEQRILEGK